MKLKYFEFAGKILGKSVYESALDIHFGRFVTANFTRSFLAQLNGLHVNYKVKYFIESFRVSYSIFQF